MRAAVIGPDASLSVETVDDPKPGPHDVVLEVTACGICGSDLKVVEVLPPGYVMGHEYCGRVIEMGSDVANRQIGDLVCALPVVGCGVCDQCLVGEAHHCRSGPDQFGVQGRHGAYGEYVRADARQSFAVPEGLADRYGALVEPLAVGIHAVDAARLRPGEAVLVIGGGPVGITTTIAARALGAREVVVSEPLAPRRELASACGATATIDPGAGDVGAQFSDVAEGPPDVVIEAVGVPGMIPHAVDVAGPKARVVVAGLCTAPDPFVPFVALIKELTLAFAIYYRRSDFTAALRLAEREADALAALVTASVDLDGLPDAFAALREANKAGGEGKVLYEPVAT